MSRDFLVRPGTTGQRLRDAAIHLTPIVPAIAAVAVIGRPALWAAAFLPFGPLAIGRVLAGKREAGRDHWIRSVDFSMSIAAYALCVYGLLQMAVRFEAVGVLVAIGILLLVLLLLNWLLFTMVAANRARYGELFDPPLVMPLCRWLQGLDLSRPRLKGEF